MTDVARPGGRFQGGEFRVGHVFSLAWSVFSRNFLTFMLVTGVASLPGLLMPQAAPGPQANPFGNLAIVIPLALLMIVLGTLSQAVVLYSAFQVMRGRPIDLAESARIGLRRILPIIGLAITVAVLASLASVFFVIPGVMLYVMWFVATPVCVVEQVGPFRSMGRSRELTKGYRWKVFGLMLAIVIPALIIGAIVAAVALAIFGTGAILGVATAMTSLGLIGKIANLIWSALWTAFYAIVIVVTYHDLRVAKEGIDTEQIAAVFE
jgi:uncharacterized membrane protein